MNERITIFKRVPGQNDDGEVIPNKRKDIFECWAEIPKATVKEFMNRSNQDIGQDIQKRKETVTFNIRYRQKEVVDSSMLIDFRGRIFQIIDVETDYMRKDFTMIKAVISE